MTIPRQVVPGCDYPFDCPQSNAPHFELNPRVAAKNKWARMETLLRNRGFAWPY
jgi:hypothetical protein